MFKEATKYPVQETVLLDLIQEGTVGLMEAAEKFDIEQGVAFSLYAIHRIEEECWTSYGKARMIFLWGKNRKKNFYTAGCTRYGF
ncbi:MAG: sigma factor [Dialister invisus]